jgi:hypothetical protein
MNPKKPQIKTTINISKEGIHKMDSEGVSKVNESTGEGLFVPFTMTHNKTGVSFSGSALGKAHLDEMKERHGPRGWEFT